MLVLEEEEGPGVSEAAPAEHSAKPRTWPIGGSEKDTGAAWGDQILLRPPTDSRSLKMSRGMRNGKL